MTSHAPISMMRVEEYLNSEETATIRREKRLAYAKLQDLEEYVLVVQDAFRVEVYRTNATSLWEVDTHGNDETVMLRSLDPTLPLDLICESSEISRAIRCS